MYWLVYAPAAHTTRRAAYFAALNTARSILVPELPKCTHLTVLYIRVAP